MPELFCHPVTVGEDDIDAQGHANNVVYLRWAQEAAVAHSDAIGWTAECYRDAGVTWVVRTHQIRYRSPAGLGDELVVRTWVENMRAATSLRRYEILRKADGLLLADAGTDWVLVGVNSGAPSRIPPEIRRAFLERG
jgi:acyl-CoA thioester hydrolase